MKKQAYFDIYSNNYFRRTYNQAEIDYIEEYNSKIHAYEFKYSSKTAKVPKSFVETYPEASFEIINKDNFLDFVLQRNII
jgi:hypothetical protein